MGALSCVNNISHNAGVFTVNTGSNTQTESRKDPESQLMPTGRCGGCSFKWMLGVDLPLLLIVAVVVALYEFSVIPQRRSGFYCNDPALSFPFTGDTVSAAALVSTVLLLPLVVIFGTEMTFYNADFTKRSRHDYAFRKTLSVYKKYIYGLFLNFVILEVMKAIVASPRPMFFDVCQPDTGLTCNGSEYVSTYKCTSTKYSRWMQSDSYHSFPSGHTSMSVLAGFFAAWYLQKRAFNWRHRSVCLVPLLQILCISYSCFCSLSRITDHRHHWWDVLAGAILGFVTLFYTVAVLCKNFESRKQWPQDRRMTASQQTVQTFDGPEAMLFEDPESSNG